METKTFVEFREKLMDNISKVIVGKKSVIDCVIVAFICGGHVLLDDVPGTGKTKLCRSMAATLGCSFKRVQFTPDLLPSDLTGIYFYNQKSGEFEFRKGPLLSEFVLADEINRATPRTQSALLECMEEGQITVEGNTVKLGSPFFVMATENPVEQFGTFPLPEAQLDRFFMRLSVGYPEKDEESTMLDRFQEKDPLLELKNVVSRDEINFVQENYKKVSVSPEVKEYIVSIVRKSRESESLDLPLSPRATLALMRASQGNAAINGRHYVLPEDVKLMAPAVLSHRIILRNIVGSNKSSQERFISELLNSVDTPLEEI